MSARNQNNPNLPDYSKFESVSMETLLADARKRHVVRGWQPVETAPRNREVLITDGRRVETAQLDIECGDREWLSSTGGSYIDKNEFEMRHPEFEPTHWMPLPEPPKVEAAAEATAP